MLGYILVFGIIGKIIYNNFWLIKIIYNRITFDKTKMDQLVSNEMLEKYKNL